MLRYTLKKRYEMLFKLLAIDLPVSDSFYYRWIELKNQNLHAIERIEKKLKSIK